MSATTGPAADWRHRAACRSVDPEFFPVAEAGLDLARQVAIAKAVCCGCLVRAACLTWASAHQPDGIAGGLTEQQRRTERSRRVRARARQHARITTAGSGEGEGASVATVAPSRVSHEHGLAGHTSCGRTPRVDDDPGV